MVVEIDQALVLDVLLLLATRGSQTLREVSLMVVVYFNCLIEVESYLMWFGCGRYPVKCCILAL